jgi:hypothetical protein
MAPDRPRLDEALDRLEAYVGSNDADVVRSALRDYERQGARLWAANRRVAELEAEVGRLRAGLREIAERGWVEHLVEPTWASSVADAVLRQAS